MKAADNVAEVARIPLLQTFELSVYEFLNLLYYVQVKNEELNETLKK